MNESIGAARVDLVKPYLSRRSFYKLGAGGFNQRFPNDALWDGGKSDCSGFASFVLRMARFQGDKNKPWSKSMPWIETSAIYWDGKGHGLCFACLTEPERGCFVVYADHGGSQGHIEMVESVYSVNGRTEFDTVGCAGGVMGHVLGRAIRRRVKASGFWKSKGAIFVCLKQDLVNSE